jgi:MoxR-like ATPase
MADELNRASPKSQSAFLQAMEEQAITVDGVTRKLPDPYVVIATQNSLDSAGTNPLPESQLDRFMMVISLGLPARAGEKELLMESGRAARIDTLDPVCSPAEMAGIRAAVAAVSVSDKVADYILDLATWLRSRAFGFSTRTAIALTAAARSWAYAHGRDYVMPGDVQAVAKAVLAHRLNPKGTATLEGSQALIEGAIKAVEVH